MYCCSLLGERRASLSPGASLMFSALADRITAHPRRTLLFVALFVVIAGVVGGPVAGSLKTDGGFAATSSGSARAEARIERATGRDATPRVVALMRSPRQAAAVHAQHAATPGIASVAGTPTLSRDGRSAYLLAT